MSEDDLFLTIAAAKAPPAQPTLDELKEAQVEAWKAYWVAAAAQKTAWAAASAADDAWNKAWSAYLTADDSTRAALNAALNSAYDVTDAEVSQ